MNYILLLAIGIIWGSQFVFINSGLHVYSPEQLALLRTFYASLFLIIFCFFVRRKRYKRTFYEWLKVVFIAILEVVIPFTLVMWGQQYISVSMAAILMGTIPFFALVMVLITKVEKSSMAKFLGVIIGFTGLLMLVFPDLIEDGLGDGFWGKFAVLIGACSFAQALIIIKSMPKENSFTLSRDAFCIGTLLLALINLFQGNLLHFHYQLWPFVNTILLGVFCSGVVYVLYVTLIKSAGAAFSSFSNYLVPLFGSLLGVVFLNDRLTWNMMVACFLILLSIAVEPIIKLFFRR
ncbi:MAG: DMT family transporter [Francisellaceae bacterium]